jgi:uroporphyrinogen decarboxylase
MNSRERMLAAINRQPIDRIPTDIWATDEVWAKLGQLFGDRSDTMAALHIDGMGYPNPVYVGPPMPAMPEGESANFWGMRHKLVPHGGGAYSEQYFYPLAAAQIIRDLDDYAWPTTDWFDYSGMKREAAAARRDRAVQCGYMAPFYYHNLLRGLELSLEDVLLEPELTHGIVGRIGDFFHAHHRRMFVNGRPGTS